MSVRAHTDARRLDQKIRIERATKTRLANGDFSAVTWTLVKEIWAAVDAEKVLERHKEPLHADALREWHNYTIWVRAELIDRLSITTADRIVWRGKVMDIVDTRHQQQKGRLTPIYARQGASIG